MLSRPGKDCGVRRAFQAYVYYTNYIDLLGIAPLKLTGDGERKVFVNEKAHSRAGRLIGYPSRQEPFTDLTRGLVHPVALPRFLSQPVLGFEMGVDPGSVTQVIGDNRIDVGKLERRIAERDLFRAGALIESSDNRVKWDTRPGHT